jgi:hypothetical protein
MFHTRIMKDTWLMLTSMCMLQCIDVNVYIYTHNTFLWAYTHTHTHTTDAYKYKSKPGIIREQNVTKANHIHPYNTCIHKHTHEKKSLRCSMSLSCLYLAYKIASSV